ncbi:MAG: hypothetical protein IPN20_15055 [Haliscomenobacter sp.]|nr:hypothetical protein [Haliscomenobacter sp.]
MSKHAILPLFHPYCKLLFPPPIYVLPTVHCPISAATGNFLLANELMGGAAAPGSQKPEVLELDTQPGDLDRMEGTPKEILITYS